MSQQQAVSNFNARSEGRSQSTNNAVITSPGYFQVSDPQQTTFEVLEQKSLLSINQTRYFGQTSLTNGYGMSVFRLDQPQPSN